MVVVGSDNAPVTITLVVIEPFIVRGGDGMNVNVHPVWEQDIAAKLHALGSHPTAQPPCSEQILTPVA